MSKFVKSLIGDSVLYVISSPKKNKHILAIDITYPCSSNRPIEWNTTNGERSAGCNKCSNVSIYLWIERQCMYNNLHLIKKTIWKKRSD